MRKISGAFARGARRAGGGLARAPWRKIGAWTGGVAATLIVALLAFVTFADWNLLKGPISRAASAATGREIIIAGDLDVNPWSWTPDIHVSDVTIGNPARFRDRGLFARVRNADMSVRLLPLVIGRFDIVKIDLNGADLNLYRTERGDSNWTPAPNAARGRAFNLPAIRHFTLQGGQLKFEDDKRHMVLEGAFTTAENASRDNPGYFELNGEGQINGRPFALQLTGAPLLNVRRDQPYRFNADVRAGGTHINAEGAISRPFDFSGWTAAIEASGPDLADLYQITGLTLPNTPPYNLSGRIERRGQRFGMPDVHGRVGDSDVRGAFVATRQSNDRLFLEGDFRSNSLDFDDLMAVLGGAPSTGRGETVSAGQRQMAANLEAQGRLLPDAQLDISRVRNMDARVSFRAAHVRSERVPLRGLSVDINLDNGLLRLDPLALELSRGRIGGAVSLNAREDTPLVNLDVRLSGARIESVLAFQGQQPLQGALVGRARLSGRGGSVRDAAANASGDITLATSGGEVRETLAELTGINVTRALGLIISDDEGTIPIRCGVASFNVQNGRARARTILIDTETMLIGGSGSINLRDETMDLRIQGDPKEPRLIRLAAPITVEGHLRSPEVGIEAGDVAGQSGIAALLASLVAPLAAVLPFVDPGLAEDANCAQLLAGRRPTTREG